MLEFYILQSDNKKQMCMWNIFNNYYIHDWCIKERNKYKRSPKKYKRYNWKTKEYIYGYEAFKDEIASIIMHELWSRCQYEFYAQDMFAKDDDYVAKIDGWFQCKPNIELICQIILKSKETLDKIEE